MAKLKQITPFLMCSDIRAEIAFFENYLGFTTGFLSEGDFGYAFMHRDNAAVRLLTTDADLTDEKRQQMVYIDVDDVDALWAELGPNLSELPKGRVRAPFNQPYNQREFHVIDEGPNLLMFGQGIDPP
ncbi:glyoxalase/bleomycin resistance protein/dioxygenase superfamily protein [Litoreibacter meonggei]|uniref:Glyoxalase/bleomycin resistance protein/dioxygenase superfamily protein n=1 Tax=Litoreibacter meonggei TaxID=1049199 RepID=A0A497VUS4_9RHOB|nr:VOC family protein [Litoreibacter meonggei]RLJ41789.1 glyoxalase/bleomycin resistance protein/dioxygenase superfamily protein [Litoreibacter meonggei]